MAELGAMPRPVSLPGQCFSHYPIMSRLCMLSGLHLLWFSVAWMDCTLGNPPKADPTSLAIHINVRPDSSHLFSKIIHKLAQWGWKKERKERKGKKTKKKKYSLRERVCGMRTQATAGRGISIDQNNKVTKSMYKECHSLVHSASSIGT